MADPSKFHLLITAGPTYSPSTHNLVAINTDTPSQISSSHLSASLSVRIQNYRGLPTGSPSTSPYFSDPAHKHDLYSISFNFTPKEDIRGDELVFGNDFENPIRDHLPPGFNAALRIVKWAIDPGLDGDVYADHPYLYGPALSSINVLRIGEKGKGKVGQQKKKEVKSGLAGEDKTEHTEHTEHVAVITEGADGEEAEKIRHDLKIPAEGPKRMKHFLTESHRREFVFEKGREYSFDFFNPYLDFNDLALRLPGMSLYLMRFWDGQALRYTLKKKNATTEEELLVVIITLVPEEEFEGVKAKWEGKEKKAAGHEKPKAPEKKQEEKSTYQDDDVD